MRCISFHSVKGGVGKSTLCTAVALRAADSGRPTYLLDFDFTGTSLADGLPILPSSGEFADRRDVFAALDQRSAGEATDLRFLNDFLLARAPEERPTIRELEWTVSRGPASLSVVPSSALPRDVESIVPLVFDEEYSGYIEARAEDLLAEIIELHPDSVVVLDVPPTIPGLSRAILNLGRRLGTNPLVSLAQDNVIPAPLREHPITWNSLILTTLDRQDVGAAIRWLATDIGETAVVSVVVNRTLADHGRTRQLVERLQGDLVSPDLEKAIFVCDDPRLQFFHGGEPEEFDLPLDTLSPLFDRLGV